MAHRTDRVDRYVQRAVCAVLEAYGEGEARGEFAVQLAFGRACPDGADAEQVGQELWTNRVKHLAGERHAHAGQVDEELPADAQALVDLEAVVDVRVVDQPLPADRRTRLFQVGPHYDQEVGGVFLLQSEEARCVVEGGCRVVDGAGADDDEESAEGVGALHDGDGFISAGEDGGFGGWSLAERWLARVEGLRIRRGADLADFVLEEIGGSERVVAFD